MRMKEKQMEGKKGKDREGERETEIERQAEREREKKRFLKKQRASYNALRFNIPAQNNVS